MPEGTETPETIITGEQPVTMEELQASVNAELTALDLKPIDTSEGVEPEAPKATQDDADPVIPEEDAKTDEGNVSDDDTPAPEEKAEDEVPETVLSTLDPVLINAARRANYSDEEIEELGDKAPLVLNRLKDVVDNASREFSKRGKAAIEAQQPASEPPATQTPITPATPAAEGAGLSELGIDDSELEPDTAAAFKQMRAEITALKAGNADVREYVANQKEAESEARAQRAITLLDDYLKPLTKDKRGVYALRYGKGGTSQFEENSLERHARLQLLTEADQIFAGATQMRTEMTPEEALDRAFSILHKHDTKQEVREEVASQLRKRSSQSTHKPTNRSPRTRTDGVTKARRIEAEFRRNNLPS